MEPKEIVNKDLEKLEGQQARLPNGEIMDLYSIREEVLLYGISIEGDEYIRSPLFYGPGEAILHALHPAFYRDTIGFATPENPANSKSTTKFVFSATLRIREYRFDSRAFFYDARERIRPTCLDVGVSNFKNYFYLRLPTGINSQQPGQPVRNLDADSILSTIVSGQSSFQTVRTEAFYFCQPGKTLRIDKSFTLDMAVLWTFYASLLKNGYTPVQIRNEAFSGPKSKLVLRSVIKDQQIPTTIGDLPEKISKAIANRASLEELLLLCPTVPLGQKACASGLFFRRLWERDVLSILTVYPPSAFLTADKNRYYPFPFVAGNRLTPKSGRGHYPLDPYISTWFYKEDLMEEMGRDVLAYNWNYNRFLDVNTVLYWVLFNLQKPVPKTPYQKPFRDPFLLATSAYNPQKHLSLIKHRFSDAKMASVTKISLYDSCKETAVILSFDPRDEAPALTDPRGLYITVKSLSLDVVPDRGSVIQKQILTFLQELSVKMGDILPIVQGAQDALGKRDPRLRILSFLPSQQTIDNIPSNWLVLPFVSTLLRYLIRTLEFDFFLF